MQRRKSKAFCLAIAIAMPLAAARLAAAQSQNSSSASKSTTFGSRTTSANGSVALSVGRRLPTTWDAKIGMDANLVSESPVSDTALHGISGSQSSSGALWGSVTGPSIAPLVYDKTAIDARLDPGGEQGKVGATLSRTVPLGDHLSVILRDNYSLTSRHGEAQPLTAAQTASSAPNSGWNIDRSLSLNLRSTGTTLSAGRATSSADPQWHNKLSAEQKVFGPLSVTTSITDPGTAASNKSISAGFKHTW
jgi:hypothetical protein